MGGGVLAQLGRLKYSDVLLSGLCETSVNNEPSPLLQGRGRGVLDMQVPLIWSLLKPVWGGGGYSGNGAESECCWAI